MRTENQGNPVWKWRTAGLGKETFFYSDGNVATQSGVGWHGV